MVERERIASHPFVRDLPDSCKKRISRLGREVSFEVDEVIFRAGKTLRHFYLLISGSVCVEINGPGYRVCIDAVAPGGAFGWGSLLPDHRTTFQVRCREPHTVAVRLDADKLSAACLRDPSLDAAISFRIGKLIAERLRATESKLVEFCGVSSAESRRLEESPGVTTSWRWRLNDTTLELNRRNDTSVLEP